MIYLNFLLNEAQKSKVFKTLATVGLILIIIYVIINAFLIIIPAILNFIPTLMNNIGSLASTNITSSGFSVLILVILIFSILAFMWSILRALTGDNDGYGIF